MVSARFEFEGGCVATVTTSRVSLTPQRKFRLIDERQYISLDLQERSAMLAWKKESGKPEEDDSPEIDFEMIHADECNPLLEELSAFIHSVKTRELPLVCGVGGLRAVKLAHQVLQAVEEHQARSKNS
jgi:hypothetical protein